MYNRDWERLGNDIFRTVQDAVESCNYDRLNQNISDAVNQVVGSVTANVRNMTATRQYERRPQPVSFAWRNPSMAGAILWVIFGSACSLLIVFGGFAAGITGALGLHGVRIPWQLLALWELVGCSIAGMVRIFGGKRIAQIRRFRKYVKLIGNREYCNISELASGVQEEERFVAKDIEQMIRKGWFCQGHLDAQRTCLMVTDQMYWQYRQLEEKKAQFQAEEQQKVREQKKSEEEQKNRKAQERAALSPEVQKVIEQGDWFVQKIRECNDAIPGEEISAKIYHMELIVDKIFDRVEAEPDTVSDVRKLMDYYLPTTIKLLEAYAQMDAQPIGGENIQTAKREIEATLDTLNEAFEKLLDSLFQEAAWDVSSDISVLNTMLAQEGLKSDGLKK